MDKRPDDGVGDALDAGRRAFVAALLGRAVDALAAMYADDARLLAPSAEVFAGRSAIVRFWGAGMDAGIAGFQATPSELRVDGDAAQEIGRYELRLRTPDGAVLDRGKYFLLHRRQPDGAWLRSVEMLNPDSAPTPVATPDPSGSTARAGGDQT